MRFPRPPVVLVALICTLAGAGADPQPDFSLSDANPNSPRFGQLISPRQYREQITAWYFGSEL